MTKRPLHAGAPRRTWEDSFLMTIRIFVSLFSVAVFCAAFLGATANNARAQMQLFDGFDEQDPVGSAVVELHRLIAKGIAESPDHCGTKERPTFFFAGSGSRTKAITDPQRRAVDNLILQNLERLAPGAVKSIDEIGAVLAVQESGSSESFDTLLEKNRTAADFEVVAEIARTQSVSYNMSLRARSSRSAKCAVDVLVPVAPEYMPVLFLPPEQIFWAAANQIYKAESEAGDNSETIAVDVTPPTFGEQLASKETGTIVQDLLKEGLVKADEEENVMQPRRPDVYLRGSRGSAVDARAAWIANVKIIPGSQGLRVRIDADRPGARTIIEEGFIPPEAASFAPESTADSTRQAMGLDGTEIKLGLWPQFTDGVINQLNRKNRYFFSVEAPSVVELAIMEDVDGKKYGYKLRRVDGKAVAPPVVPKPNRFNTARFVLDPGIYMLEVAATKAIQEGYRLRSRIGSLPLDPLAPGKKLGQAGDWLFGVLGEGPTRQCYALTPAVSILPEGWRVQRPVLQIVISAGESEKAQLPQKIYDRADTYKKGSPVEIKLSGSDSRPLQLTEDQGSLMALQDCKTTAGKCIIPDSINQLTFGSTLAVTGTTAKGEPSEITYSLVGYRAAVAAIAAECDNAFIGQEMVRR
jgi:hypothetical protein